MPGPGYKSGDGPRGKTSGDGDKQKAIWPCDPHPVTSDFGARSSPTAGASSDHDGIDIGVPAGTEVHAVLDGKVTQAGVNGGYGNYVELDHGSGVVTFYGHLQSFKVKSGDSVRQNDVIALSNNTGTSTGDHLHFGYHLNGVPTDPMELLNGAGVPTKGGSTSSGGAGSFSEEDIFAIGRAAAISTQLELPGLLNYEAAMLMTGSKSIYNDEPLLPFIQQLAQASLRNFQSLPDGTFFAFYPDQFGTYNHRKPYWEIDDIEIVDGSIELSDEALATHVFVVGDTIPDGQISVPEMVHSTGVVTVFDAFASSFMIQKDDRREDAKKGTRKVLDRGAAMSFLRRYGVRPHYEEATFIRNHMFEMFYAFTQFQLLWSRQFLTQFSFTFMPELYPGGVVAFPDHGIRCYIDSVTHTFDYEGGFTTQANLSAPAAYRKGDTDVSQGMVRPITNKQFNELTNKVEHPDPNGKSRN
jgi:hypothetical protein